jgi:hypothetical protein
MNDLQVNSCKLMELPMVWNVGFAGEPPCKVALMQLCVDKTHCYLMHIIHSGVPPILKSLLEDSSSVKVGNYVSIIRSCADFSLKIECSFFHTWIALFWS